MRKALFVSAIALHSIVSCGSQNDVELTETTQAPPLVTPALNSSVSTTTPATTTSSTTAQTAVMLNPAHGKPGHRCDIAVGAPLNGSATTPVVNAATPAMPQPKGMVSTPLNLKGLTSVAQPGSAGLNPAHGKPGHRCDIAVGAPLNSAASAPVQTTTPAATPTISASALQTAAPAATTGSISSVQSAGAVKPGMNPQHGQPGHRCDIAVGAPLNSKPAPASTVNPTPTAAPAVTTVAPGMNPQHGQPGHRCDIAVGAPLNSKPATTPATTTPAKKDSGGGK